MGHRARRVGTAWAALVVSAAGTVAFAQSGAVQRLRQGAELVCEPEYPVFCANVHVTCAGRTAIAAFVFRLRVADEVATMTAGPEGEPVRSSYDRAGVSWGEGSAEAIVQPASGPGYLRIDGSGRYSLRHYIGPAGVMSIGRCR